MPKPCAYNLTRREIHYRHEVFSAGLRAAGYQVWDSIPYEVIPGDVVLGWNRYGQSHDVATRIEKAGGIYIAAENGYIGPGGVSPHHMEPRSIYALARHAHNGAGTWAEGGPERWDALGVALKPWRADGGHVLVVPNRPFGMPGMAMPQDWASDVKGRLAKLTKREIRVRPHPGNDAPRKPLADDLRDCWAVVIWSSSAGVHALVAGIPVCCESPFWICKGGRGEATQGVETDISFIEVGPRLGMFSRISSMERLAWAQFNLQEIESGFAFASLLRPAGQREIAASS